MSAGQEPELRISATYLGPVFSLEGELTKYAQNLVFARNGIGKSFLSRALRFLDLYGQGRDIQDAADHLVSEESSDGAGQFSLYRGASNIGELQLEKTGIGASASVTDTIFHVFSEDFVH